MQLWQRILRNKLINWNLQQQQRHRPVICNERDMDNVMGGAEDNVMGGAEDNVMGRAEDNVMGEAENQEM